MVAAWDARNDPNILVGILHVDTTTVAWALGLRALKIPGRFQEPLCVAGMPFDDSRNVLCQRALELGADGVFMLDSDVVAPVDTILRLWKHNLPIVSGVYYRRSPPEGIPVMQKPVGQWITNFPKKSLIEVDVVGAGCLLLRRSLLENCPPQRPGKHWFDWRVCFHQSMPREECLSEDFTFMTHIRRTMGIKTYVDTSIECKHIGFAQATNKSFKPLDVALVG